MKHMMPDGSFVEAPTYGAARKIHDASKSATLVKPVVPVVAKIVQTTVTAVITAQDNFIGRNKVQFGVGERLDLSFTTTPAGASASSLGGLQWYIKSGAGTLVNAPGNTGLATYTCPATCEADRVTLELRTVTPPVAVKATKSFVVVEPKNVVINRQPGTGTYHRMGIASAGFKGEIFLEPRDVSFRNLEIREGSAPSVGTGSMSQNLAGFADIGAIRHPTIGTWVTIGNGNFATGCKAAGIDTIKALDMNPPFAVGNFTWSIPWYYRVVGTAATDRQFAFMHHEEAVDAAGAMTMTKGGTTVVHNAADPNSNF
jgi:hypothetical protein